MSNEEGAVAAVVEPPPARRLLGRSRRGAIARAASISASLPIAAAMLPPPRGAPIAAAAVAAFVRRPGRPARILSAPSSSTFREIPGMMIRPPRRASSCAVGGDGLRLRDDRRRPWQRPPPSSAHRRLLLGASSSTSDGESGAARPLAEVSEVPSFAGLPASEALRRAASLLESRSAPEAEWCAVHLLSDALGLAWEDGYRRVMRLLLDDAPSASDDELGGRVLTEDEAAAFSSHLSRRLDAEPLQYILGRWDFLDFALRVRPPCLCPRPETEELVERAAESARDAFLRREARALLDGGGAGKKGRATTKVRILDVGCGTGAIGVALARMLGPDKAEVVAIDVDPTAVNLSNENARDLLYSDGNVDPETTRRWYNALLCAAADFTNDAEAEASGCGAPYQFDFDLVVSNPPYIPRADMSSLTRDVVGYESDAALCGGLDGLDVVRDIVARLPEWAAEEGGCECWMEVDTSHPRMMEEWLRGERGEEGGRGPGEARVEFVRSVRDLSGRERFVQLRLVR